MSTADMEFMIAPEIREGLKRYIDTVIPGYTNPTPAYFEAVLRWQKERHNYEGKAEWIVTTSGVVQAFVVDGERKILYAHYAKSVSDMPDAAALAKLLA